VWQVVQVTSGRIALSWWQVTHASVTGVSDPDGLKERPSACVSALAIGNHALWSKLPIDPSR
jgi:hypothetical protein